MCACKGYASSKQNINYHLAFLRSIELPNILLVAISLALTLSMRVVSSSYATEIPVTRSWKKDEFPNPQRDFYECGRRGRISWVCDPANITRYGEGQ